MGILRVVLGVIVGAVVAFAGVFASDMLLHLAAPQPMPSPNDQAAMAAYAARLPPMLLVAMCLGWAACNMAGALIGCMIAQRGPWPGWIVTFLFLAATIANFMMVPHPFWMAGLAIALIVAAGGFGSRIGANIRR